VTKKGYSHIAIELGNAYSAENYLILLLLILCSMTLPFASWIPVHNYSVQHCILPSLDNTCRHGDICPEFALYFDPNPWYINVP
jgi:hypothetical protein